MSTSEHIPGTVFLECPACGGKVWDNRDKIESGEWKAKSPHFACADKNGCGWASWPHREKKGSSGAARAAKGALEAQARTVSGPLRNGGYSWEDHAALGQACLDLAVKQMGAVFGRTDPLIQRAVVAWAATNMIGARQDKIMPTESLEDMPTAFRKEPDDLPFDEDPGMEPE